MRFYSFKELRERGIAPSESQMLRLIKAGKISPPYQREPGCKRAFDDNHIAELLGRKKPATA
jgi:hypothetical protein